MYVCIYIYIYIYIYICISILLYYVDLIFQNLDVQKPLTTLEREASWVFRGISFWKIRRSICIITFYINPCLRFSKSTF